MLINIAIKKLAQYIIRQLLIINKKLFIRNSEIFRRKKNKNSYCDYLISRAIFKQWRKFKKNYFILSQEQLRFANKHN